MKEIEMFFVSPEKLTFGSYTVLRLGDGLSSDLGSATRLTHVSVIF